MQFDGNHEQPLICFCRMLSRRTCGHAPSVGHVQESVLVMQER